MGCTVSDDDYHICYRFGQQWSAEISFWDVGRILVNKISHGTIGEIKELPVSVNIIWFIRMPRILLAFVGLVWPYVVQ
jgi:hypothetical protein